MDITLREITENNWTIAAEIEHTENQRDFVADGIEILALAYVYRNNNAKVQAIYAGETMVGLLLVEDLNEEPCCYHLHELLIDKKYQNKGFGSKAIKLLLSQLAEERKFPRVEVCVHSKNTMAISFYKANGFKLNDYIDEDSPWNRMYTYTFANNISSN